MGRTGSRHDRPSWRCSRSLSSSWRRAHRRTRARQVRASEPDLGRNPHGRGTALDTPTLRGLWLTAPYFPDGAAATLNDLFGTGPEHDVMARVSSQESDDLIEYLFSLPGAE